MSRRANNANFAAGTYAQPSRSNNGGATGPTGATGATGGIGPTGATGGGTILIPVRMTMALADLQAFGSGLIAVMDVGVLPANARVTQPEVIVTEALTGPGLLSALSSVQSSTDAIGTLVTSADCTTVGGYGFGLNPYPSRGGQLIQHRLVMTGIVGGFAALTAGEFEVRLVYNISAT